MLRALPDAKSYWEHRDQYVAEYLSVQRTDCHEIRMVVKFDRVHQVLINIPQGHPHYVNHQDPTADRSLWTRENYLARLLLRIYEANVDVDFQPLPLSSLC